MNYVKRTAISGLAGLFQPPVIADCADVDLRDAGLFCKPFP